MEGDLKIKFETDLESKKVIIEMDKINDNDTENKTYILKQIDAAFKSKDQINVGTQHKVAENGKIKLKEIDPLLRKNAVLRENNYF